MGILFVKNSEGIQKTETLGYVTLASKQFLYLQILFIWEPGLRESNSFHKVRANVEIANK
jgi:hypothetical protein